MRGSAGLEEVDDAFGFGGEVELGESAEGAVSGICIGEEFVVEEGGEGDGAQAAGAAAKELAARYDSVEFVH